MRLVPIYLIFTVFILAVGIVRDTEAKPFNNDGICETIVVENGEIISTEEYPCE